MSELLHLEQTIERQLKNAWFDTGLHYGRIRDEKLFRQGEWSTWAEYCPSRWDRDARSIDDQIQKAKQVAEMREISLISEDYLPSKMSQATELAKLDTTEERAQVWQRVIENSNGAGITAKVVQAEVAKFNDSKNKDWITLSEWAEGERWHGGPTDKKMNKVNENIEWAEWSWNPVTGCLHNCAYCYARDIADRFYEYKFEPAYRPARLSMPSNTKVGNPRWEGDTGHKNVFTCSMADLFGKWVPQEWIESVLATIADNPQWTFLLLSKFPVRMAEFTYPSNVWLGTSVDRQHAVQRAESAFTKIKSSGFNGVCWLSCEPMLERLTFSSLEMFDWVVMGGASKSTQTPEYKPDVESEILHLHDQARTSGCMVYWKTNLMPGLNDEQRIREYPS